MRRLKTFIACALCLGNMSVMAADFETATVAVRNMGLGWNLGNTLEANGATETDPAKPAYWGGQDVTSESYWGQMPTRPQLLKMMREAGFGAIRVPVTWYNHMDMDGNVDAAWMARVKEVVDYVVSQGLYCIINVHHDTGADSYDADKKLTGYHWIKADEDNFNANKARFEKLWQQIALTFKDYGQELLFEGYNEMLDKNSCWNYPASVGTYNAGYAVKSLAAINSYAQSFVSTVRQTGGNNAQRNLIVSTYAAAAGGNWGHADEVISQMKRPDDTTEGHLIFEVHNYPDIEGDYQPAVDYFFSNLSKLQAKGCPVIIGEWGTANVDKTGATDYDVRREKMFEFCEYFINKAKAGNIGTFYWMGVSDGFSRTLPAFSQPDLAKCLLQSYHGSDYNPVLPVRADYGALSFTVDFSQQWGELYLAKGNFTTADYIRLELELEEAPASDLLQVLVKGTSNTTKSVTAATTKVPFNGTVTAVHLQCKKPSASVKVKGVWLVKKSGEKVPSDPSVFWGCTIRDISVNPTGIAAVTQASRAAGDSAYDLMGRQIQPRRGSVVIRNGKKYIQR